MDARQTHDPNDILIQDNLPNLQEVFMKKKSLAGRRSERSAAVTELHG
jgi:hypothetical protein